MDAHEKDDNVIRVRTRKRTAVLLAALVAVGSVAVSGATLWTHSSRPAGRHAHVKPRTPVYVTEVPTTLPARGVSVNNQVVLTPLTAPPKPAMTAREALLAAGLYGNKSLTSLALEANVTLPDTIPAADDSAAEKKKFKEIVDVPAWVITFTSPRPVDVSASAKRMLVTHQSVSLDATTGKFIVGFFTK